MLPIILAVVRENAQAARLRFFDHPIESDQRHALLGIAASYVRVDAGEPDLFDVGFCFPQDRLEGGAGFVDAEGLRGRVD